MPGQGNQIQAAARTQPRLPLKRERVGTMTRGYQSTGTTTLFAEPNELTADVMGQCLPRHRRGLVALDQVGKPS